jgi:hypothetical protein
VSEADPSSGRSVGYRRPPIEHQFRKGVSGNPNGRPKRKQGKKTVDPLTFSDQPANRLLMEEFYREVTIREGDKLTRMPLIQGIFRALGVQALKGNRFALQMVAEAVQQVENSDRENRSEYMKTMMDYKCTWEERIEQALEEGRTPPNPLPHPDDIFIDFVNSGAVICGPRSKEEKAEWDRVFAFRDGMQRVVSDMASAYQLARRGKRKESYLDVWKNAQRKYDEVNDDLPPRYRRELEDRCWEEDASRPGSQKTVAWPNDS